MVTYFLINGKYITKDTTITVLSVLSITKRTIKTTYLKKSANKKDFESKLKVLFLLV